MYHGLYVNYLLLLLILMKLDFFRQIFKNTQISKFMKICPVTAELFHAVGQTEGHDEANSHFS
jgi:hypothetical protein